MVNTKKMVKIEKLFNERKASKIVETEKERYIHFFENTYKENLEHCKFCLEKFPRWSIISGYYSMHDITKLFLAKKFMLKVDFEVHKTAILILKELVKDKEILNMLEIGYKEFISLANDLAEARSERTKAQYYTGTAFMKEKYKEKARQFLEKIVLPYISKIKSLLEK